MPALRIRSHEWVSESSKFNIDSAGKVIRAYTRKYITSSIDEGSNWDLAQGLNYSPGDPHPSDPEALLIDIGIDRRMTKAGTNELTGPWNWWDVSLDYSTDAPQQENNSTDPSLARVLRGWTTSEQTLYAIRDRLGNVIVNAANQPFDGGVPVTIEMPTLKFVRNELIPPNIAGLANKLNSDTYAGAAPETLKLKVSSEETFGGGWQYWATTYEMTYYALGWQPQPVNAGLMQLKGGALVPCLDRDKNKVTSPVPLDVNGLQVPIASLPGGANFIQIDIYPTMAFSSLGLLPPL